MPHALAVPRSATDTRDPTPACDAAACEMTRAPRRTQGSGGQNGAGRDTGGIHAWGVVGQQLDPRNDMCGRAGELGWHKANRDSLMSRDLHTDRRTVSSKDISRRDAAMPVRETKFQPQGRKR